MVGSNYKTEQKGLVDGQKGKNLYDRSNSINATYQNNISPIYSKGPFTFS